MPLDIIDIKKALHHRQQPGDDDALQSAASLYGCIVKVLSRDPHLKALV